VPVEAVRETGGVTSVQAVREGRVASARVETGVRTATRVEISTGVAEGERVLLSKGIADGTRVRPREVKR
jgi:hypothetical protein